MAKRRFPWVYLGYEGGGVQPSSGLLRISMFMNHTWNLNDPTDWTATGPTAMTSSPFLKGANWATWEAAITARIVARGGTVADEIIQDATTVHFAGQAIFDSCAMCDIAIVRAGTPLEHMNQIRFRSGIGTRVIQGFINAESINQFHGYTEAEKAYNDILKTMAIAAGTSTGCTKALLVPPVNGWNSYECTAIDKYEILDITAGTGCTATYLTNAVACPHTPAHSGLPANTTAGTNRHNWEIDLRLLAASPSAWVNSVASYTQSLGSDGNLVDNLLTDAYKGFAQNDYDATYGAAYRASWITVLAALQANPQVKTLWANGLEEVTIYTAAQNRNRFYEFAFRQLGSLSVAKTETEINTMLGVAKTNGLNIMLGTLSVPTSTKPWAESNGIGGANGTWASIAATMKSTGVINQVWVNAARSTSTGYIYWQPEFRRLM